MYKDRHARVEKICENCGVTFFARVERVSKGQGKFCSRKCYNAVQKDEASELYGFENGKTYKSGNRYVVRWQDESGKIHTTSYANWWWNINVGEVPLGYVVSYVDNNYENLSPENFELKLKSDVNRENGSKGNTISFGFKGKKHTDKSKKLMSKVRTGKTLSESHRKNIGQSIKDRWQRGDFDNVNFNRDIHGENNYFWRGGAGTEYPEEFNRRLKKFIWDRDNNMCQICGKLVSKRGTVGHVHHIDGHKENNEYDNLILLCIHCHAKIHHGAEKSSPVIMAFRSKLYWNS